MRIENNYLILDDVVLKKKKITGHSFVDIAGLNPYVKKGDAVLERLGVIKTELDPKWLRRGDFAEKIALFCAQRDGHICTVYDKNEVNYDNFKENANYGGLIDIELLQEFDLIEVKSKSMKDYDKIVETQPQWEVMQGIYYSVLRQYPTATLVWIFFDEETENQVFKGEKPTTLKNLKKLEKKYIINDKLKQFTQDKMVETREYLTWCYNNKKVPLDDISDATLKQLGLERPQFDSLFDTLNF